MSAARTGYSDAQLRRLYCRFNRDHFAAGLPEDTVLLWEPVASDRIAETQKLPDGRFKISMSPSIAGWRRFTRLTLLHEMCHIPAWSARECHGKRFKAETLRMLTAGAIKYF